MDRVRFVEPKLGLVGVGQAIAKTGFGMILAGVIGLLAMIVVLTVGELGDVALEAMARAMGPGLGIVVLLGGLLSTAGFSLDRSQRIRTLTRSLNNVHAVPPTGALEAAAWSRPRRVLGIVFAVVCVMCALLAFFGVREADAPVLWTTLVAAAVSGTVAVVSLRGVHSASAREEAALLALDAELRRRRKLADAYDAEARARLPVGVRPRMFAWRLSTACVRFVTQLIRAGAIATGVTIVCAFVAEIVDTHAVERVAFVGSILGFVGVFGSLLLGFVAGGVAIPLALVGEGQARRWAAARPARFEPLVLAPALVGDRAAALASWWLSLLAGALVVAWSALVAVPDAIVASFAVDYPILHADVAWMLPLASALLALGLLVAIADLPLARRDRTAIRDRLFPGDVGAPTSPTPTQV